MSSTNQQSVMIIAHSFAQKNGGIARVARLMAKVLADLKIPTSLLELAGDDSTPLFGHQRDPCQNSKATLLRKARKYARKHTHVIFDAPNRARILPLLWPHQMHTMTFCHGIEVWENAHPSWIKAAKNSQILLCNSKHTKTQALALHPELKHMQVCPLATEEDTSPPSGVISKSTGSSVPTVIIVARMAADERYKGHQELIEAWPEIVDAIPEARLQIIGSGDDAPRLQAIVQASPSSQQINFLGMLSEEALQQHYASSALFAMPSRNEGFGLVYIEAMRHALPILTSTQDAGQELITDGETGITVDLDTPGELAKKIIANLSNREKLRTIGQQGQAHWQQCHSYDSFKETFSKQLNVFMQAVALK